MSFFKKSYLKMMISWYGIKKMVALRYLKRNGLKKRSIILCFHDICIGENEGLFSISYSRFEEIIVRYSEQFISLDEISAKNGLVLTFDDAYFNVFSLAYPLLKSLKIPFTVFMSTDFIGKAGYLDENAIETLSKDPLCIIGAHMCSHRKTREMNKEEIKREWVDSKKIIEELISKPVSYAALPYGSIESCSKSSIKIGLHCGYEKIATTLAYPYKCGRVIPRFVYSRNRSFITDFL